MIASFRSRALKRYWTRGDPSKIAPALVQRVRRRLGRLEHATKPEEMNVPGFGLARGLPSEDAIHVDLEDYH